jgi:hypothetical protein
MARAERLNILKERRPEPFIGYEGIGSRIGVIPEACVFTIKQTVASQVKTLLSMGLLGPGLTLLAYFQWEKFQKSPGLILGVLILVIAISWFAFLMGLVRLMSNRRVEIRKSDKSILLYHRGRNIYRTIRHDEIVDTNVYQSHFRQNKSITPNYTLIIDEQNGQKIDLVTSDQHETILKIKSLLES